MLVLTRRQGERIVIGEGIWVMVVELRADSVRLGITAPREIAIDREEVRQARQAESGERRAGG